MFHSSDGLFFRRNDDKSVTIIKTTDTKQPDGSNVLFEQTLDDGVWCSAVCSVSHAGEEHLRWYKAMDFHNLPIGVTTPIIPAKTPDASRGSGG